MTIRTQDAKPSGILDYSEAAQAAPKPVSPEEKYLAEQQTTVPADRVWPVSIMRGNP